MAPSLDRELVNLWGTCSQRGWAPDAFSMWPINLYIVYAVLRCVSVLRLDERLAVTFSWLKLT